MAGCQGCSCPIGVSKAMGRRIVRIEVQLELASFRGWMHDVSSGTAREPIRGLKQGLLVFHHIFITNSACMPRALKENLQCESLKSGGGSNESFFRLDAMFRATAW